MEDFKDRETAQSWDADPVARNPVRPEQLDILLSILEDEYETGKAILDIGMGSGIVEELILRRITHAYVVGVDASEAMLEIAHQRLREYSGRYEVVIHDFTQIDTLKLPEGEYQAAISVQAIHNVAHEYKLPVFRFVHQALEPGGIFLLLDRIAVDTPGLFSAYRSVWERLNRVHRASMSEGETFEEHMRRVAARGDLPASLEQHLVWLREAGFEATCLHLHANRALFCARKPYG
ncbi:MAG TPA: class I SAM-dependent methyltransferase [Chloroflexia bacterium]|nr:class I SAM-dependent methyltransferase [Chloroflexia bacterium]